MTRARRDPSDPAAALAAALPPAGRIAVAVSGGSDSTALLLLAQQVAPSRLSAVTVDHGLRPEAADEARQVAALCARLGVPHAVLRWEEAGQGGNLMDRARRARRGLIAEWAREQGVDHVLLGHTADDQAETFLMRLSRAAGIDGLSPMAARWDESGVTWHRPLLRQGREDLRDWLRGQGAGWIEDPTNADPRFERARIRRLLALMAQEGLGAQTLAQVSRQIGTAREALDRQAEELAARALVQDRGDVILHPAALAQAPAEARRRLLVAALRWIGQRDYPPRAAALERLEACLLKGRGGVLNGVRLLPAPAPRLTREVQAVEGLSAPPGALWDGRWRVEGPFRQGDTIAALGEAGLSQVPGWRETGLPRASLLAAPAVWRDGALIAAPLARVERRWTARITADFALLR
ncbi:tRNA lysidine(34) synthetase TilS [Pseudoroseicyclus aestuarii]|uniref:tRNA(Ile)-lysidine synthase n=1 Tax=Pseudoroseicyclus aestuarii TaxID=1795041 RepID=A0A318SQD1_9RHOB|nr:tRNA lysidine(34) synthetase TilS [Pseudoroseicyclus aestuarii]PYE83882.1 tRNA(Ile)-lysidine synthase [Pseudoroseicyclus aestuarii]